MVLVECELLSVSALLAESTLLTELEVLAGLAVLVIPEGSRVSVVSEVSNWDGKSGILSYMVSWYGSS